MPSSNFNDFPARGRVSEKRDDQSVVFKPTGTNYELVLVNSAGAYDGPVNVPVNAIVRLRARKVYTVPSGGNFVTPIFGPPKIIQGRVKAATERSIVVHAGTNFVVDLPPAESAIDLNNGSVAVGSMVNVVALPGATFELAPAAPSGADAAGLIADQVAAMTTE